MIGMQYPVDNVQITHLVCRRFDRRQKSGRTDNVMLTGGVRHIVQKLNRAMKIIPSEQPSQHAGNWQARAAVIELK